MKNQFIHNNLIIYTIICCREIRCSYSQQNEFIYEFSLVRNEDLENSKISITDENNRQHLLRQKYKNIWTMNEKFLFDTNINLKRQRTDYKKYYSDLRRNDIYTFRNLYLHEPPKISDFDDIFYSNNSNLNPNQGSESIKTEASDIECKDLDNINTYNILDKKMNVDKKQIKSIKIYLFDTENINSTYFENMKKIMLKYNTEPKPFFKLKEIFIKNNFFYFFFLDPLAQTDSFKFLERLFHVYILNLFEIKNMINKHGLYPFEDNFFGGNYFYMYYSLKKSLLYLNQMIYIKTPSFYEFSEYQKIADEYKSQSSQFINNYSEIENHLKDYQDNLIVSITENLEKLESEIEKVKFNDFIKNIYHSYLRYYDSCFYMLYNNIFREFVTENYFFRFEKHNIIFKNFNEIGKYFYAKYSLIKENCTKLNENNTEKDINLLFINEDYYLTKIIINFSDLKYRNEATLLIFKTKNDNVS